MRGYPRRYNQRDGASRHHEHPGIYLCPVERTWSICMSILQPREDRFYALIEAVCRECDEGR